MTDCPEAFAAVSLPYFKDPLVSRFEGLKTGKAGDVLNVVAAKEFWTNSIERFGNSGSYRSAESNFDTFVRPFANRLSADELDQIFGAIEENGQIWDAGGIPDGILETLKIASPARPSNAVIDSLFLNLRHQARTRYTEVWDLLKQAGWTEPGEPAEEE